MNKKVLVSGIQPTGDLHIGNYFGAMKQNIDLGNSGEYESYIFIADYHALTTVKDKEALKKSSYEIAAAYIACGLNTGKVTLFRQSSVPEHVELSCIFNNVVTMPYLMRAHAFKDRIQKNQEAINVADGQIFPLGATNTWDTFNNNAYRNINIGLFTYPVLMAADILMYNADVVPVGKDQKQHIEYARDIAGFYNRAWGVEQFKLPEDLIVESVAIVPGTDGEKMSKSKGNVIPLFGSDEDLKKAVMGIVTDSSAPEEKKNPDTNNIYNIHKLFLSDEETSALRTKFEEGGYGYKQAKEDLLLTIMKWRAGKKEIFDDLMAHPEKIESVLSKGGAIAREKAKKTMYSVRHQIGVE